MSPADNHHRDLASSASGPSAVPGSKSSGSCGARPPGFSCGSTTDCVCETFGRLFNPDGPRFTGLCDEDNVTHSRKLLLFGRSVVSDSFRPHGARQEILEGKCTGVRKQTRKCLSVSTMQCLLLLLGLLYCYSFVVIRLPMQEPQVQSLGREDPLVEEMVTPSSILAWEIPWMRSLVGCGV